MANPTKMTASPGGREVIIERVFDAPREKVWKAYTDPELVIKWLGPRRLTGKIDAWELEPGGRWGLTHTDAEGNEYAFHGFFHEILAPERITRTFEFHGAPGHISLETATLEDQGGKTKLTATAVFQTPEDRDAMIQSGMEKGVNEGNERLAELLVRI